MSKRPPPPARGRRVLDSVAMSLDGFIAGPQGEYELDPDAPPPGRTCEPEAHAAQGLREDGYGDAGVRGGLKRAVRERHEEET
jgi:hypothetical protein